MIVLTTPMKKVRCISQTSYSAQPRHVQQLVYSNSTHHHHPTITTTTSNSVNQQHIVSRKKSFNSETPISVVNPHIRSISLNPPTVQQQQQQQQQRVPLLINRNNGSTAQQKQQQQQLNTMKLPPQLDKISAQYVSFPGMSATLQQISITPQNATNHHINPFTPSKPTTQQPIIFPLSQNINRQSIQQQQQQQQQQPQQQKQQQQQQQQQQVKPLFFAQKSAGLVVKNPPNLQNKNHITLIQQPQVPQYTSTINSTQNQLLQYISLPTTTSIPAQTEVQLPPASVTPLKPATTALPRGFSGIATSLADVNISYPSEYIKTEDVSQEMTVSLENGKVIKSGVQIVPALNAMIPSRSNTVQSQRIDSPVKPINTPTLLEQSMLESAMKKVASSAENIMKLGESHMQEQRKTISILEAENKDLLNKLSELEERVVQLAELTQSPALETGALADNVNAHLETIANITSENDQLKHKMSVLISTHERYIDSQTQLAVRQDEQSRRLMQENLQLIDFLAEVKEREKQVELEFAAAEQRNREIVLDSALVPEEYLLRIKQLEDDVFTLTRQNACYKRDLQNSQTQVLVLTHERDTLQSTCNLQSRELLVSKNPSSVSNSNDHTNNVNYSRDDHYYSSSSAMKVKRFSRSTRESFDEYASELKANETIRGLQENLIAAEVKASSLNIQLEGEQIRIRSLEEQINLLITENGRLLTLLDAMKRNLNKANTESPEKQESAKTVTPAADVLSQPDLVIISQMEAKVQELAEENERLCSEAEKYKQEAETLRRRSNSTNQIASPLIITAQSSLAQTPLKMSQQITTITAANSTSPINYASSQQSIQSHRVMEYSPYLRVAISPIIQLPKQQQQQQQQQVSQSQSVHLSSPTSYLSTPYRDNKQQQQTTNLASNSTGILLLNEQQQQSQPQTPLSSNPTSLSPQRQITQLQQTSVGVAGQRLSQATMTNSIILRGPLAQQQKSN